MLRRLIFKKKRRREIVAPQAKAMKMNLRSRKSKED
jgi:hypothetical protein